ncbi:iron-hydroxamate ABC transporter substrate-binding protein [Paenibacillus sp. MMS20-IR301]|uniref:iron-hydroxamate ABC transporter substrate-binding protein n=1 Tax=Paenibacillus sp. MMS20-IR301 TaxID=2895946 RepID=UPI0028EB8A1B|nr:iron-hydroxamate ABC transporter substrate-binding protein [Paenibacillus sp. MMS20-IR301]WNS41655.1 iron-hydroxamate ABC transporter substrate-binding protein [Paenibacillus sp. MMS20-IR301]
MRYSKKSLMLIVFTLVLAVLLAACGQSNSPAQNSGAAANAATAEPAAITEPAAASGSANASGEAEIVTFKDSVGEVQVPKNPQRIVDTTAFYTGYFLALGVKPVGVLAGAAQNPYFEGKLDGVEIIGDELSPENILALNPDMIIVYAGAENIEKLKEIAPVVAIQYGAKNYKDQMLDFGKLVNRNDEAKAWIDQWEARIAELKPQVQAAVGDKTVSILNPYSGGLYVFGHNYGRGGEILYGEFGLKAPAEAQKEAIDSGTGWASISLEKLPEFAGDIIFTCPWSGDTTDPKIVYDNPVWTGLPAVKAGNVFQLNPSADTYNDPVSLEAQLDFISTSLLSVK